MNLFDAITRGDWDLFNSFLARGDDVFAVDNYGDTILHKLARLQPVEEGIFSKKKSIRSYFIEILHYPNKAGRSILDLALIQNSIKILPCMMLFPKGTGLLHICLES